MNLSHLTAGSHQHLFMYWLGMLTLELIVPRRVSFSLEKPFYKPWATDQELTKQWVTFVYEAWGWFHTL